MASKLQPTISMWLHAKYRLWQVFCPESVCCSYIYLQYYHAEGRPHAHFFPLGVSSRKRKETRKQALRNSILSQVCSGNSFLDSNWVNLLIHNDSVSTYGGPSVHNCRVISGEASDTARLRPGLNSRSGANADLWF
jgi:hypothetical protein